MKKWPHVGLLLILTAVLFFSGCDSTDKETCYEADVPENANSISLSIDESDISELKIMDSEGYEVSFLLEYDKSTGLVNIFPEGISEGKQYYIYINGSIRMTVTVTAADNREMELVFSNISNMDSDVEVNLPIQLNFNKTIDGASINSQSVLLYESKYDRYVPVRYIYDYNKITIIPQMRLQQNLKYELVIDNIKDITGKSFSATIAYQNRDLDYGLYFYGKYGKCEKYFPGVENIFYDKSKKTVIYSHGWQPYRTVLTDDFYGRSNYYFESFYWEDNMILGNLSENNLKQFTNHGWIDKGWNTGLIYWGQFADEPPLENQNVVGVHDAEAKLWTFDADKASRYRVVNSSGLPVYKNWDRKVDFNGETLVADSVGELLSFYVNDALKRNTSGNLRLVGHSLGNQISCILAKKAYDENIIINRVALLDPAWTAYEKNYLPDDEYGKWVGERCRKYIFEMKEKNDDFAVEIYHTTGMNIGLTGLVVDQNYDLADAAADVNVCPWFYMAVQLVEKHNAIKYSYFWSMNYDAPAEVTIKWWQRYLTGEDGPSASTSDSRICEMMGEKYEWTQVEGRYTPSPADDQFERKTKSNSWFTLF